MQPNDDRAGIIDDERARTDEGHVHAISKSLSDSTW
jgi:hypothetical protein